jgi:hypothetical protein
LRAISRETPGPILRGNNASLLPRAALMLTTEALVSELPEEKKEPAGGARGSHGMGDIY